MKRLLIALSVFAFAAAHAADVQNNPAAKIDPKNNKVSKPVVTKPKEPVMTRAELRSCIEQRDANEAEVVSINAATKDYKDNTEKLKAERDRLEAATSALNARTTAAKAEYDAILKANEEFKAAAPKMEKADFEAKKKELTDRSAAFEATRDAIVTESKTLNGQKDALGNNIDKNNEMFKSLDQRRDKQLDNADDWKANCSKKKYDENDEAAIMKERAAAKAAAAAASK
ncbi:MAG TPA: hypothetical protein VGM81_14660 [Burkholderiaceae bacterium]|jgi:chromosome segregation ATPase